MLCAKSFLGWRGPWWDVSEMGRTGHWAGPVVARLKGTGTAMKSWVYFMSDKGVIKPFMKQFMALLYN